MLNSRYSNNELELLRQRVVAVVPVTNSESTIGSIVIGLRHIVYAVIVVDDGSTDSTASIAEQGGAMVIRHDQSQSCGTALKTGFREARRLSPLAVVTLSADGQYSPTDVPHVVTPILNRQADIVIGSRYLQSGRRLPFLSRERWYRTAVNILSGVPLTDPQSGFRAISPWVLSHLAQSDSVFIEIEMQFFARKERARLQEVFVNSLASTSMSSGFACLFSRWKHGPHDT